MNDGQNNGTQDEPERLDEFTDLLEKVTQATEEGRSEDALGLLASIMALMADAAENQVPSLHIAIRSEAHDREAVADWAGAEAAYRRAIAIAGDNAGELYRDHLSLVGLYRFLGRLDDALQEARAAVDAGASIMEMLQATAMLTLAGIQLDLGQAREARDIVTQAIPLYPNGAMAGSWHAGALALRARCLMELEEEAAARNDLDAAWRLLEKDTAMAGLAGIQWAFGSWWRAEAGLRKRTGDLEGCVKAWREVVLSRRWNAAQPQIAGPYIQAGLADALEHLALAQEAAGDAESAAENMAESRSIRYNIEDPPAQEA